MLVMAELSLIGVCAIGGGFIYISWKLPSTQLTLLAPSPLASRLPPNPLDLIPQLSR
jgi:hypothetical protein